MRAFIVANPKAGAGQVEQEWTRIERLLKAQLSEFDFAFTQGPGHGTVLTREALRAGWEMIVAIGGDGTFNEIANGFFEKPDAEAKFERAEDGFVRRLDDALEPILEGAVLGLVPMGTGGDFRRSVGLMGGLEENIARLGGGETRDCDVGQLTFIDHDGKLASRFFINIASAGMGGEVDRVANNMWKGFGGGVSFRIASTRAFMTWKNRQMVVRLDDLDEVTDHFFNVVVANGEYFGGGMWVAPGAKLDDGSFQVVLLGNLSKWHQATLITKIYKGDHLTLPGVSRRTASQVSVRALDAAPVLLDVDGEQPGRLPALFNNHPRALRLKV